MINIVPFIEAVDKFRNLCLFRYLITVFLSVVCRKLSITCKLRNTIVVNNGLHVVRVYSFRLSGP